MVREISRFRIVGVCAALVFGSGWLLRIDRSWILGCTLAALVVPWAIRASLRALRSRRARAIDPAEAGRASRLTAMRNGFTVAMRAIDASPATRASFASAPFYVLIGAAGCGKTTALRESGLGLAIAGASEGDGGTENCAWWRGANVSILDTAGRYLSDPSSRGEWLELLSLVRARKGAGRLNGVVLAIGITDLIALDAGALQREAAVARERIAEVADRLGVSCPVHVLFTKCDLIGGFKDFFSGLSAGERDQAWGGTLQWPNDPARSGADAVASELVRLGSGAQARRLAILQGAANEDQARKIYQFPGQFAAVRAWIADFICEIGRGDGGMAVRGFYFSSAVASPRPPLRLPFQGVVAAKSSASAPAPAASVFLKVSQFGLGNDHAAAGGHAGLFLREAFAWGIIGDRHLARPSDGLLRRRRFVGWLARVGAPICCGIAVAWMLWSGSAVVGLAHASRYPLQKLQETTRGGDVKSVLASLDDVAVAASQASRPFASTLSVLLCRAYRQRLEPLLLAPCVARLHADLEHLRLDSARPQQPGIADDLYESLRAYRMLTGSLESDVATIVHALSRGRRWFAGIEASGASPSASPEVEALAQRQLAFLSTHLGDVVGAGIDADRHLVEQIEYELADSLWIREAYDETINALQGSFPQVRRDSLVFGPFRDLIDTGGEFSEIYTQKAFDVSVRPALRARAAVVAQRFGILRLRKPTGEIVGRLEQRFREDFDQHWMDLLSSTRFHGVVDVRELPGRMALLVGAQSPYRELVKAVWKADHLQLGTIDLRTFTGDGDVGWLEPALEAVRDLAKDLERFAGATEPGKRSADPKRVRDLAESFDAAWAKISLSAKTIDQPLRQAAILKGLQGLLQSILASVTRDLTTELDHAWLEKVRVPYLERCAKFFPFDPAASDDVPLAAFARMFNPVSGTYWATANAIDDLHRIRAVGAEVVPLSKEYERMHAKAQQVASGCFVGGERLCAPFTLALRLREGVKDIHVALCDRVFGVYDRPDAKGEFSWKEGCSANAKLSITVVTGQALSLDFSGQPWGLMRLLRAGDPQARPDGSYLCTWRFDNQAVGRDAISRADGLLSGSGFERVLVGDVFADFTIPESIGF